VPNFIDKTDKFDGKTDSAIGDKGAYREATITLYEKKIEEMGKVGQEVGDQLVATFGHEAQRDLDPIQVQAGKTGTGSNAIWHPEKNGKPAKQSPYWVEDKIEREIKESRRKSP
jgi:hypothetical protein